MPFSIPATACHQQTMASIHATHSIRSSSSHHRRASTPNPRAAWSTGSTGQLCKQKCTSCCNRACLQRYKQDLTGLSFCRVSMHHVRTRCCSAASDAMAAATTPACGNIPDSWAHDVLLVDGANVVAFARSTATTVHSHVQGLSKAGPIACFELWIKALQDLTSATQTYVIFDDPENTTQQHNTPSTLDRRQLVPGYKVARTRKRLKSNGGSNDAQDKNAAIPASQALPLQPELPKTSRNKFDVYARACERMGCLAIWSPRGREADDVLMALAGAMAIDAQGSTRTVAVASSDGDMQQLLGLGTHVKWLELLQLPGQSLTSTEPTTGSAGPTAMSDHVAAMQTTAWANTMAWLPVRKHSNWPEGVALPPHRLPPNKVADYQALVGKKEAGVKGAGISGKAAVSLLKRFGGVAGVAAAVREGRLDARLQPSAPKAHQSSSVANTSEVTLSPGVQQAMDNLHVTRLGCDLATLPLDQICMHSRRQISNKTYSSSEAAEKGRNKLKCGPSIFSFCKAEGADIATSSHVSHGDADLDQDGRTHSVTWHDMVSTALKHPVYVLRVAANASILAAAVKHGQSRTGFDGYADAEVSTNVVTAGGLMLDFVLGPMPPVSAVAATNRNNNGVGGGEGQGGDGPLDPKHSGWLVLGPADFNLTAVEQALYSGVNDAKGGEGIGAVTKASAKAGKVTGLAVGPDIGKAGLRQLAERLSSHVGLRQGTSHLPNKLKALLRVETQLLLRGLKKARWEVNLVPFWEVLLADTKL